MKYENIKVEKKENSEVEINGDITVIATAEYRVKALKELSETLNVPGFRRGHIPEKTIVERIGEVAVLEEAAELALKDAAPEIIEKNTSDYIGRPNIAITKLVPGNPISFKITISVIPDFTLPDYKKIAKEEMAKKDESPEVTEKEIENVIEEVRKQRAHHAYHLAEKDKQKTNAETSDNQHKHDDKELEKHMPEFNDEFVKSLGNFTDVADFKAKAKENMTEEKKHRIIEKKRGALLERLVADTTVAIPDVLVENEIARMYAQFEGDITNMGMKVEDYLKHIKKTPDDIRKEWLPDATKRAKLNLILEKIAKEENIVADQEAVEHETKHLLEIHKGIDPLRTKLYVEHILTIEKAIKFLEEK